MPSPCIRSSTGETAVGTVYSISLKFCPNDKFPSSRRSRVQRSSEARDVPRFAGLLPQE